VSIYQDLVEAHGFTHRYNSVKRFVAGLRARAPERFDVLEFLPGEEAQVDYGQGAPMLDRPDRYKRPYLFVMTLKYSGKSFRKTVWKTDQQIGRPACMRRRSGRSAAVLATWCSTISRRACCAPISTPPS
jgi:hypothetical protein